MLGIQVLVLPTMLSLEILGLRAMLSPQRTMLYPMLGPGHRLGMHGLMFSLQAPMFRAMLGSELLMFRLMLGRKPLMFSLVFHVMSRKYSRSHTEQAGRRENEQGRFQISYLHKNLLATSLAAKGRNPRAARGHATGECRMARRSVSS